MAQFANSYERWVSEAQRSPTIEAELSAEYQLAWEQGDTLDRIAALYFLFVTGRVEWSLLVEGLQSNDDGLAEHAASIGLSWVSRYGFPNDSVQAVFASSMGRNASLGAICGAALAISAPHDS